jgi:hypothetical protein
MEDGAEPSELIQTPVYCIGDRGVHINVFIKKIDPAYAYRLMISPISPVVTIFAWLFKSGVP